MLNAKARAAYFEILRGAAVDRAAAVLPQTGNGAIFTVAGGRIALLGIIGEYTVAHPAAANAMKLTSVPTVGTLLDLCTAVDQTGKELGALVGITGTPGDALQGGVAGGVVLADRPLVIPVGSIKVYCAGNGTVAQIKWKLMYLPIDNGATVVAA